MKCLVVKFIHSDIYIQKSINDTQNFWRITLFSSRFRSLKAIPNPALRNQKSFTKYRVSGYIQIVSPNDKGFYFEEKILRGRNFEEIWENLELEVKDMEAKSRYLYLEEYISKLLTLMDSFWVKISTKRTDICWLVKVRGYLDKVEKEQQKIK